jgi:hypothetical protein
VGTEWGTVENTEWGRTPVPQGHEDRLGACSGLAGRQRAQRVHVASKNEPAKIFIFGQKYTVLGQRKLHYILVHGTLLKVAHREHIMALCAQRSNCGEIAAFIRQEAHWADLWGTERQDGFVRDGVGRIGERRPNVVRGQAGICVQEIFNHRTLGEFAE